MGDDVVIPDKAEAKDEFGAVKCCPKPKKKTFVFMVTIVEKHTGKPVRGIKVEASGLGQKKTNGKGLADFGKVNEGTSFDVVLNLSDADSREYFADPKNFSGVPAQLPGSKPFKIEVEKRLLELKSVDPLFAPGIEKLEIKYNIQGLQDQTVVLEISSKQYSGNLVSKFNLAADQKATGKSKLIQLDGKGTIAGKLKDKFFSPQFSPFKVTLKVEKAAPLNINLSKDKSTKVEIDHFDLEVDAPDEKLLMNDPERNVLVASKVFIKKKAGGFIQTPIEFEIFYTLTIGVSNTKAALSHIYSGVKTLGKKDDPNALYWKKHPDFDANSPDTFKLKCSSVTRTTVGPGIENGVAKIFFLPSGVSGDTMKIKSEIFQADGVKSLVKKESKDLAVWRKVKLEPYEMDGLTHVSTNGTSAIMLGFYLPEMFVEYELGTVHKIVAKYSIKYFALWDHATDAQLDWATHQAKTAAIITAAETAAANGPNGPAKIAALASIQAKEDASETPSAAETTAANGAPGAAQTAARASIQAKANVWKDRIIAAYNAGFRNWHTDAGVPDRSVVGIQFEHPKYSVLPAGDTDSQTNEWSAFPWLRITVEGNTLHPDARWVRGQGVTDPATGIAYVITGLSLIRVRDVIAHEAGHASSTQFKRLPFGGLGLPDHSDPNDGLMDTVATLHAFTAREKEILRGLR